jgi:hypothetical protein
VVDSKFLRDPSPWSGLAAEPNEEVNQKHVFFGGLSSLQINKNESNNSGSLSCDVNNELVSPNRRGRAQTFSMTHIVTIPM